MNPENDMYRHFILNQRQTILHKRKIYTPQYFCLMLTMIIIGGSDEKLQDKVFSDDPSLYDYILSIIAILIAFVITSFSQFIGHRLLYILSLTSYQILYIVIFLNAALPSAQILVTTVRLMLFSQIIIQIYGIWPQKFGRIFVELILFYSIMRFVVQTIDTQIKVFELSNYILIAIILLNFLWLVCGQFIPIFMSIKDFKSPETDSVLKDFGRLLSDLDIKYFSFLIIYDLLSLYIILAFSQNYILQILAKYYSATIINIFNDYLPLIGTILVLYLVNHNYKPLLMISFSCIPLVVCLLIIILFLQLDDDYLYYPIISLLAFIFNYFFYIEIFYVYLIYTIPQYCQILLVNGIRNLDFASSCQLLVFGQLQLLYYIANNWEIFSLHHLWIVILFYLIPSIIFLSFLFHQLFNFELLMRNRNIAEIQMDDFQIEII